jgi:Domain of Unknown Function (DUF1206)
MTDQQDRERESRQSDQTKFEEQRERDEQRHESVAQRLEPLEPRDED